MKLKPVIIFKLLLLCSLSQAQDLSFSADSILNVAQEAKAMVSADFNGDEAPDLVLGIRNNTIGHHLAVFLNKGNGTFSVEPDSLYIVGKYPDAVAVADFNGDEFLDLVTTIREDSSIWILFGNGNGTFGNIDSISINESCEDMAVSDFNNDQNIDFAVVTRSSNLFIYNGNGNGTFQTPNSFFTGGSVKSIEVFDMNKDNFVDILVGTGNFRSVALHLNDGVGGFATKTLINTAQPAWYIRAGHLNWDDFPDIVVGSGSYEQDNIFIYLGNSSGTYTCTDTTTGTSYAKHLSVGDFDRDGKSEVLAGDRNGVSIISCNANGKVAHKDTIAYEIGYRAQMTNIMDLDGDEKVDILIARDSQVHIFYNTTIYTSITKINKTPDSFLLHQNYPNPFNPKTTILYEIPATGHVEIEIFNLLGQKIQTVVNEQKSMGRHSIVVDGNLLPSGIYFYSIRTQFGTISKKMHLIK